MFKVIADMVDGRTVDVSSGHADYKSAVEAAKKFIVEHGVKVKFVRVVPNKDEQPEG